MKKIIGNTLIVLAFVFLALAIVGMELFDLADGVFMCFAFLYAACLIGGIALRIGDFFKWRAKMHQQGVLEAQQAANKKSTHFCSHCGKGLTENTAFCPHCGNKLS